MGGAKDWKPGQMSEDTKRRLMAEVYGPEPEPPWCPVGNIPHHDVMTCTLPACKAWAAGQRKRDAEDAYFREAEFLVDMARNEREA